MDLIVIGAGFAGLAALEAARAAGAEAVCLEARDRAGGRAWTEGTPQGPLDRGAQFLNRDMHRLMRLTGRLGLPVAEAVVRGRRTWIADEDEAGVERAARELDGTLDVLLLGWTAASPETSVAAAIAADVEAGAISPLSGRVLTTVLTEAFCLPCEVLMAAHVARSVSAFASDRDELEAFLPGGLGELARRFAAEQGEAVRTGHPVDAVARDGPGWVVRGPAGAVRAARVVVAVPPPAARRIALPAHLEPALDAFVPGEVVKLRADYARPFWREQGLSGQMRLLDPAGVASEDTSVGDLAALTVFAGGPAAREVHAHGAQGRREWLLARLERAFGPEARAPLAVHATSWVGDRWSAGGYNSHVAAGRLPDPERVLGALHDGLTFAGAEIAEVFPGYVEGALASGQAAAARVLGS